ncbi:MAG: hypothetical protein IJH34_00925 [Romboutsia sp.]|nr:hypothetical protein [Romboutsia sp.]
MIFTVVSKKAPLYGIGTKLAENYYELHNGIKLFFYDVESIEKDFGNYRLIDFVDMDDVHKGIVDKHQMNSWVIKCKKSI